MTLRLASLAQGARIPVAGAIAAAALAAVHGQQPPPGISRDQLVDNQTALIAHLRMEPGSREMIHTHPFSAVVIQMTPGEIDMTVGEVRARQNREPGFAWFIPKDAPHAAINSGTSAVEFITIGIKPDRPAAAAAPPTQSPPGITRETLIDNDDARVVRVTFAPGGREPVHTHPNDLVTVQITPGRVAIIEASAQSDEERKAGFVKFLSRGVSHSYASTDTKPFQLISVAIK
jgi:quercetin dioxygenase-like cupin family protein